MHKVETGLQNELGRSHLVSPGCSKRDVCLNNGCQNGGTCVDEWNQFSCRCPTGYVGSLCDRQIAVTFNSDDESGLKFTSTTSITSFSFEFSSDPSLTSGMLAFTDKRVCL